MVLGLAMPGAAVNANFLPRASRLGFIGSMTKDNPLLSTDETVEILDAAYSALDYALAGATSLKADGDEVVESLIKSIEAVKAAWSNCGSPSSLMGQVANALRHLRASLKTMQEMNADEVLAPTIRASARALALLYPLTQTEGPLLFVPRKSPGRTRRKLPVAGLRGNRRPLAFEVELGDGTDTNFFTGLEGGISSGGLFIATYDIHPIGTRLNVRVKMPSGRVMSEEAVVNWIREFNESAPDIAPGMGVVFTSISPKHNREIDLYLADRETIFYEAV
jgi:uncharacterized protein (TIGR02266 family)